MSEQFKEIRIVTSNGREGSVEEGWGVESQGEVSLEPLTKIGCGKLV